MTINVVLATNDALIFGCDSIASMTGAYVDPFTLDWQTDSKGKLTKDKEGNFLLKFNFEKIVRPVTNSWGGVTKMFQIHEGNCNVAAVTAGLANLNDRTMKSLADEFLEVSNRRTQRRVNITAVVNDFMNFLHIEYKKQYRGDKRPDYFKDGPEFLVGGYGRDDAHPSLYLLKVKDKKIIQHYGPNHKDHTGIAWNGQSSCVERVVRGYDSLMKKAISEQIDQYHQEISTAMLSIIGEVLAKAGAVFPKNVVTKLPKPLNKMIGWESHHQSIDYANMPLQDAIDFVSFLVNLQSGRDKFVRGVATVGGRTHIGIITKATGFNMINEPEIAHKHTGFGDDGL